MKVFKRIRESFLNPAYDFQDRLFVMLTAMVVLAIFAAFIVDIHIGENLTETVFLGVTVVFVPLASTIFIRAGRIKACRILFAAFAIFVLLPVTFFFGGGVHGGSIVWIAFAFFYVGLILTGRWRMVMLSLLTVLALLECYASIFHPELIVGHEERMGTIDQTASVIVVGLVFYGMVWFQNLLFVNENAKAREEAKKVEEMSRSQNQFFSNMSHEIRTPINTIIGLNEMILREDISDEVAEDAANIQSAGKILLHLINDILDMSRIQSGQMELTRAVYAPGEMLSELVGMLWMRARDKGLAFHVNVSPDIPAELYGDEVRIKQILINLLNNAIKYTREGSVTLSVECGEREGDSINIIYSVTDTGIGIRKESIPHLFTVFRRADEANNRYIEGTGLGLSIVKQLVDMMGGRITVNSIYTKGSTFMIEIPQKVTNASVIGQLDMEKRHIQNVRDQYRQIFEAPDAKLLVVDDNESNLLVVRKLLRDTKIQIDTVQSGEEALKLTLNNRYQVIFMDHLMPEMDGIECCRRIREQTGGRCRDARIVVLTANAGEDNRQLYRREGFDGYLEKPVSGRGLEEELYRLLPGELVRKVGDVETITEETMQWMQPHERRRTVAVTTESVADLPEELVEKHQIRIIPHLVVTEEGRFRDGQEIDTDGLLIYMEDRGHKIKTGVCSSSQHEQFFADTLDEANNVIHVSVSADVVNSGYPVSLEASKAFGNVTVVDSRHLSSGQGLVVLEACRLAEEGNSPSEIAGALQDFTRCVHTSFVVSDLDFLARAGQISHRIANLTHAFMMRPVLVMKKGHLKVGRIYFGTKERAWRKYIDSILKPSNNLDTSILFVTYVGLSNREKEEIRKYIEQKMHFDELYFQKASPAIAVNCGAGTFGLLYREKNAVR